MESEEEDVGIGVCVSLVGSGDFGPWPQGLQSHSSYEVTSEVLSPLCVSTMLPHRDLGSVPLMKDMLGRQS